MGDNQGEVFQQNTLSKSAILLKLLQNGADAFARNQGTCSPSIF